MKPEWKQDIKSIDHPNNPLPQFELMGYQEDIKADQRTLKKLSAIFGTLVTIAVLGLILSFIKDATSVHKGMIHQKGTAEVTNTFQGKLSMRVLSTRSEKSIKSFLGQTHAKKGFRFVATTELVDQLRTYFEKS